MLYRFFRGLARLTLHLFFRRLEVDGLANVPPQGPVLFVPNHTNALVDPLALLVTLHRRLTVTAKNVLAGNLLLRLLMKNMGVVTFHRREDVRKGADLRQNVNSLQQCREILRQGGAICIFPEGVSHSDPSLRPFHLGPARIALDYVAKDGNLGGLIIVPVGLLYTEKDRFRSDVWLRYGPPLEVAGWLAEHPGAAAPQLTQEIRRRVEGLTLNYETRRESAILTWAAEVVSTQGEMPPPLNWDRRPAAEWFQLLARLQAGYRSLLARYPTEIESLTVRVRHYRRELKRRGIEPAELFLPIHAGRAALFVVRELELLVVGAPLALFGAINHFLPSWIVKCIARKLSKDKDQWASNVIFPGLVVFPFFYGIQLTAAWLWLATLWAAVYTVALPYTGYYALLYGERAGSALRRARTFVTFLFDRSSQQRLAQEGRLIIAQIRELETRLPPDAAANREREPILNKETKGVAL
jgi:glycerol-3-phosphate O-acyltransferase / dihydroxyacetone phosphate acyltransferase